MIPLPFPLKIISSPAGKKKNQAIFEIQGLYPGYGVTIGNSLRRVLLSSLPGAAVTELRVKGVPHEFSTVPGVLEDMIMLILNLKNLRFKIYEGDSYKIQLKVKGEREVKGGDFKTPSQVELINPDIHIATLTSKSAELEMEIQIEKGIGYEPRDQRKTNKGISSSQKRAEIGAIAIDAIFTPIRNANFQVENMRVGDRTDFDKLNLEIETDGTITPEDAFFQTVEILIKHFTIISEGRKEAKEEKGAVKEKKAEEDSAKLNVDDLKFSTRTLNALLQNNIKTVDKIVRKSEKSLRELEGMGDVAIKEIKRKLKKLGLELKSD